MDRRSFLQVTAATAGGLLMGVRPAPEPEWRNRVAGVQYKMLGGTGLMISRVTMGSYAVGPKHLESVRLALDLGLNYVDTAPAYTLNDSEGGYGELFRDSSQRQRVFLQTKVSPFDNNRNDLFRKIYDSLDTTEQHRLRRQADDLMAERDVLAPDYWGNWGAFQREEMDAASLAAVMDRQYGSRIDRRQAYTQVIIDSVENSLRKMRTDVIDVLCCPHGANTWEELQIPEIHEAADRLKQAGKIRYLGFSAHSDSAGNLRAAMKAGHYQAAQVAYNPLNRRKVAPAVAEAAAAGIGIMSMKVARSILQQEDTPNNPLRAELRRLVPGDRHDANKAYALMLQDDNLTAVAAEMEDPAFVRDNMALITGG